MECRARDFMHGTGDQINRDLPSYLAPLGLKPAPVTLILVLRFKALLLLGPVDVVGGQWLGAVVGRPVSHK